MVKWPVCGMKLSLCCSIISVWGIVQFILLGIFFLIEAAPLLNDLNIDDDYQNKQDFENSLKSAYNQRAYNCWIAAFFYVGLLAFAGSQFMIHQKRFSETTIPASFVPSFVGILSEENVLNQQEFNG